PTGLRCIGEDRAELSAGRPRHDVAGNACPAREPGDQPGVSVEARAEPEAAHHCRGHVLEPAVRAERLLQRPLDDLQIRRHAPPGRERGAGVQLDRIIAVQAQLEALAQQRNEVTADLRPGPADPKVVMWASRDHAVAPIPILYGYLKCARVWDLGPMCT